MTWVAPLLEAQQRGLLHGVEVWETVLGCWDLDDPTGVVRHVLVAWEGIGHEATHEPAQDKAQELEHISPDAEPIVVLD